MELGLNSLGDVKPRQTLLLDKKLQMSDLSDDVFTLPSVKSFLIQNLWSLKDWV
jgi:hypothetical protein